MTDDNYVDRLVSDASRHAQYDAANFRAAVITGKEALTDENIAECAGEHSGYHARHAAPNDSDAQSGYEAVYGTVFRSMATPYEVID